MKSSDGCTLVALDQPTIVPNAASMRPVGPVNDAVSPKLVVKLANRPHGTYPDSYRTLDYVSVRDHAQAPMTQKTARLFTTGRSQAVRLPMEFRFEGKEVYVRRDPATGDVILSGKPDSWDGLFALHGEAGVPDDFMGPSDRAQQDGDRDPFGDWSE